MWTTPIIAIALLIIPAIGCADTPIDGIDAATAAYQRRDFDAAIQLLDEAILSSAITPDSLARAQRQRAAAYYARGMDRLARPLDQINDDAVRTAGHRDFDHAIADFDASIRLNPADALSYNGRGLAYWHKTPGYFQQARADFDTAIRLKPDFAEAYLNRGKLGGVREADASIADFTLATQLEPESPVGIEARLRRAGLLAAKGDLDHAITDYDDVIPQLISRPVDHALALEGRGRTYRGKAEFAKAIADFSTEIAVLGTAIAALDRAVDDPAREKDRPSELRTALLSYDRAVEQKDETLEFSGYRNSLPYPKWAELRPVVTALKTMKPAQSFRTGVAQYYLGEFDAAIRDFDEVIGNKPPVRFTAGPIGTGSSEAYWRRAAAYRDQGDLDQAIADFDDALKAWFPRAAYPDAAIFYGRGITLLRKGEFADAIIDFNKAIFSRRNYAPAFAYRGIAKIYASRADAAEDLATALSRVPSNPYWTIWLHLARSRDGHDDAVELAANAAKINQERWPWPVVRLLLGGLATDSMRVSAALIADARLGRIQGCEAEFYAGTFELQNGRTDAARLRFQTAADSCPATALEGALAATELRRLTR